MTYLMQDAAVTAPVAPAVQPSGQWRVRLLTTVLGLIGAAVIGYGVVAPWLSTFGGLLTQSGWATPNGSILFGLGVSAALLALGQLIRASSVLRWALALTGFAATGFAGYLLIQLYTVTQQFDGMTMVSKGPGLYFAAAGGALVFSTIFLPLSAGQPLAGSDRPATHDELFGRDGEFSPTRFSGRRGAVDNPTVFAPPRTVGPLATALRPLNSVLRYPVAALGAIAGLAHVPVTPTHLQEVLYIGVLFIVFTVVAVLAATALLISDNLATWVVLAGSCLVAIAAYTASRTIGLPGMSDDIGRWADPMGVIALLSEVGVVILTSYALIRARRGAGGGSR